MGKVITVKLDGMELEALTWLMGHELVRQERESYHHGEDQLQTVLAKLINAEPTGLDLFDLDLRLPKRIAREILRVIADPDIITAQTAELQQLKRALTQFQKQHQVKPKRKRRVTPKAGSVSGADTSAPFPPASRRPAAQAATAAVPPSGSTSAPTDGTVKLDSHVAHRLGGLRRAAQVAKAKGEDTRAAELYRRADELVAAATATAAHKA